MGTIKFKISGNTEFYIFKKSDFKKITVSYTSGSTGLLYVYFQAENNLINHDYMTLGVTKEYMEQVADRIVLLISKEGNDTIERVKQKSGLFNIKSIVFTAGTA